MSVIRFLTLLILLADGLSTGVIRGQGEPASGSGMAVSGITSRKTESHQDDDSTPWDYRPYRVLVWIGTDDPTFQVSAIDAPLRDYLDRDFAAVWRTDIATVPSSIAVLASRDINQLSYTTITAADPVLAVKRDHRDAVRIRTCDNVAEFCRSVLANPTMIAAVTGSAKQSGDPTIGGIGERFSAVEVDQAKLSKRWSDSETEAMMVPRGIAQNLVKPEAKIIELPLDTLVAHTVEQYDKIFIVHLRRDQYPGTVSVVELDTLMRQTGPSVEVSANSGDGLAAAIGRGVTQAFAPMVRVETAGRKQVTTLTRAGGLIQADDSPARIAVGDVLQPMVRKNDRNGRPIVIGPIEWAFLIAHETDGRYLKMDFYAGRSGTLQGRKNRRTFRMGLKARPQLDSTVVRLHRRQAPEFPLIGYELYERQLDSKAMTFVGRTDWDGRLRVGKKPETPVRLLYVKNGGAVLARLPLIPGLFPSAVADLVGDDLRLQAEAYIRGIQNDITDLVATRELYKMRIGKHLENDEIEQAETLFTEFRRQPDQSELSKEISQQQIEFLKKIGKQSIAQRRKVDEMFTTTREMLTKYVTPKLTRELELQIATAKTKSVEQGPDAEAESSDPVAMPDDKSAAESGGGGNSAQGQANESIATSQ